MPAYALYRVSSPVLGNNETVCFSDGRYLYGFYKHNTSTRILLYLIKNGYTAYIASLTKNNNKEMSATICFDEPFSACFTVFLRKGIGHPLLYVLCGEDRNSIKKILIALMDYIYGEMAWCVREGVCGSEVHEGVRILSYVTGQPVEKIYAMLGVPSIANK